MLPDDRGILKPHQVRPDTANYLKKKIVAAEEEMESMTQGLNIQGQSHAMLPFPNTPTGSAASVASTSSHTSLASQTSQASTQQEK